DDPPRWTRPAQPTTCACGPRAIITAWEVRRPPTVNIRTTTGVSNGQESHWIPQIAGAGRRRQPVAPDRAGAGSAGLEHHGVLQGVQRADPEDREEHADPGDHHHLSGSLVHLRDEDTAGVLLPEESRQARQRVQDARPRGDRRGQQEAAARDRRAEDEGSQLRHDRSGGEDDRRFRPLDGPQGGGVTVMALGKRTTAAREGINRDKSYPIAEAVKLVKER